MKLVVKRVIRLCLLTSACLPAVAMAQTSSAGSGATEVNEGPQGEIVVTASRRAQSIVDVPYNISAVSGDVLARDNVTDIAALTRRIPGVTLIDRGARDSGVNNTLVIRGIGTGGADGLRPASLSADTVSTYLGESPLYVNLAVKDVERVEVLRGPQGTLYGSGSLGGTIRFLYNRPSFSGFSGEAAGTIKATKKGAPGGSADLVLNVPLATNLAIRMVGSYERQGGYVDEPFLYKRDGELGSAVSATPGDILNGVPVLAPKKDTNFANIYYGRISLRFAPSDAVNLQLNYQYQHNDVGSAGGVNPGFLGNDGYEGSQRVLEPLESSTHLVDFDANVDFGFATMTSATTYYSDKVDARRDNTGLTETAPFGIFYLGNPRFIDEARESNRTRGFVQEMRLTSNGKTPLQYVIGGFYQNTRRRLILDDVMPGYSAWRRAQGQDPFTGAPLAPGFDLPGDTDFLTDETQRFREFALFGELTYNVTDQWQVTGGARVFWQTFRDEASFLLPQSEVLFGPGAGSASGMGRQSISDAIFKANTSYRLTDALNVYATFSQGFRRGGANALPLTGAFAERQVLNSYRPDKIDNYELGLKGKFGRALTFTAAIFNINWRDLQINTSTVAGAQPFVANGGTARSRGFEFEASAQLSRPWSVTVGYAFADAKLTEDFAIRTLDLGTGNQTGAVAASGVAGQRTPGTPRHSATVGSDYRFDLKEDRALVLHIDGTYRSSVLRNLQGTTTNAYMIDGFSLWNASLAYDTPRWTLTGFVNNAFNARGIAAVGGLTPDTVSRQRSFFISRPLTLGLRFAYRLGEGVNR